MASKKFGLLNIDWITNTQPKYQASQSAKITSFNIISNLYTISTPLSSVFQH